MEIERKYLLPCPPFDLSGYKCLEIEQSYISINPTIRLRKQDNLYVLTVKGSGRIVREEFELELSHAQYSKLLEKTEGHAVKKRRYLIPLDDGHTAELDMYGGYLDGLFTVEVEFADKDALARFAPPKWFGKDVSEDSRFSNARLSLCSDPADLIKCAQT